MVGLKLALSYGYPPCQLGLCGPEDEKKRKIITRYLKGEEKLKESVNKILTDFKGAYPYYQLIARANKIKSPLDQKVVQAYWTGNALLEKVKADDFADMMRKDFLPLGKMSEEKIKNLPNSAVPFHSFHVLFIGSVTGRFEETKKGLDLCRISWGRVKKREKNKLAVLRSPLRFGKKITLGKPKEVSINWNKNIFPRAEAGDWVSIHWNTAIERLNLEKIRNLEKYTDRILEMIQ